VKCSKSATLSTYLCTPSQLRAVSPGTLPCTASAALDPSKYPLDSALLQGQLPDYNEPVIIPRNKATVEDFCNRIHKARCRQRSRWADPAVTAVLYAKLRAVSQPADRHLRQMGCGWAAIPHALLCCRASSGT
jgi:hypothetical protein